MKQPHICLDETLGVRYAILPGDPARLDRIAQQLEGVRELAYNREFRSLTGTYRGVPILAVSTGIGGSSAGICVEELHNIGVEAAIRIGSCGALQKGIGLGDLILGCGAIRDDGASKAYVHTEYPAVADYRLLGFCVDAAKDLGQEALGSLGRQRAADDQAGHVIERIDELKHLLLVGLVDGGTGVDHVVLRVGAGIEEHVDARDAVGPHGLDGHAQGLGALNDKLAREAGEETQDRGVDTVVVKRKRDIEALAVGRVDGVAGTRDGVGSKTVTGDVVVNGGICSERVNHECSFHQATC